MAWICPCCRKAMTPSTHSCEGMKAQIEANAKLPFRTRPKPLSDFNGTSKTFMSLHPCGVYPGYLRKYDVARQNWGNDIGDRIGASEWNSFAKKYTTADFRNLFPADHIEVIDAIWKEVIEFRAYDKPVAGMVDLNTSNHRSSLTQPALAAFSQRGYSFRCDARKPPNVLALGFKPLYNINPPDDVQGTIMQKCTTGADGTVQSAGFWIGNRDIVNQTSICVARTLRGCGKFPTPSSSGEHYFYAFRFDLQKLGFDTEARQIQTGGRWLPGEKAFPLIVTSEIVAHTKIDKQGSDNGSDAFGSFSYVIVKPEWEFTGHATPDDRAYLAAELTALTGGQAMKTITITKAEDFVAGQ
jgi:hypothetical protein